MDRISNIFRIGLFFIILCLCACQERGRSDEKLTQEPSLTGSVITPSLTAVTPKPIETPTPKATPTPSSGITPTLLPERMPEQKVVKADLAQDRVPVDGEHFSDESFREFLLERYDLDGDGCLSRMEREQVTELFWREGWADTVSGITVLDGLDWFPKLEDISAVCDTVIYLKDHPGIHSVGASESSRYAQVWVENCENLETMGFYMYYGLVHVKDCEKLRAMWGGETEYSALYFSGTPLLVLYQDDTDLFPADFQIDGNATIHSAPMCGGDAYRMWIDEDGTPIWKSKWDERGPIKISWIGVDFSTMSLRTQMKEMQEINKGYFEKAEVYKIERSSLIKPEKGKKAYNVYFNNLGEEYDFCDYRKSYQVVMGAEARIPEEIARDAFSLVPEDNTEVFVVWFSPLKNSVYKVIDTALVYFLENEEPVLVGKVSSVHYFVQKADGKIEVYDSSEEALESAGQEE